MAILEYSGVHFKEVDYHMDPDFDINSEFFGKLVWQRHELLNFNNSGECEWRIHRGTVGNFMVHILIHA